MDKTYNELMDIVNRTKKFDNNDKNMPRPPRATRVSREIDDEYDDTIVKNEEVLEKPKTSLFDGKDAITKYLNTKKEKPKAKTSKTKANSTAKKTTKKDSAKTKKTTKSATKSKTTKAPQKGVSKSETKKASVKDLAEKIKIIKDKKVVKPTKQAPVVDMNDPKVIELYKALNDTLLAGGTDVSEYLDEDNPVTAKSLSELQNKKKVESEKETLNREQEEYEKLFTGSFVSDESDNSEVSDEKLQEVLKNNDEKNQELVLKNDDDEQTNTNENTEDSTQTNEQGESKNYSNRFDRDLEEFNNRNQELDQKIADYYKRKQQKIDDYNKSEDNEDDEQFESYKDSYENKKHDYENIFSGQVETRENDVKENETAEETINENNGEESSFRDLYNSLNSEDDDPYADIRYVTPNSEKIDADYENVVAQNDNLSELNDTAEDKNKEENSDDAWQNSLDRFEESKEDNSSTKQTFEDAELVENEVNQTENYSKESDSENDDKVYDLSDDDSDLDDYIVSSNIPVENDSDDDSVMVLEQDELPESQIDVLGREFKPENSKAQNENKDENKDENTDAISKEEFYNEMARLQESLLNQLKGEKEQQTEPVQQTQSDTLNKALDIINNLTTNKNETLSQTQSVENSKAETVANELIEDINSQVEKDEKPQDETVDEKDETLTKTNKNSLENETKTLCNALGIDPEKTETESAEDGLLNPEVALNEKDIEYLVNSEKTKAEKPNYFYLSDEDKKSRPETDEYMSVYDEKGKEMGDLNLNKNIANAVSTEQQVKQNSKTPTKTDDMEVIYTIFGVEKKKVEKEKDNIKVLYVASECQPFIATGGLGDVAGSLPKAIAKLDGIDIRLIMPLYGKIKDEYGDKLEYIGNFTVHLSWRQEYCGLFKYKKDGVTYYFVDNERYFRRDGIYGFYDDGERFAYFCKAVVESLPMLNFFPDIIHCNDWESALVSTYIKTGNWSDFRYYKIKNIYTIHNVEYQGIYGMENLKDLFGIDPRFKNDLEYNNDINLTKAAIQYSDKFTTVSDSYCDNLKQPYCSRGLHHIVIRNEYKLSGILNGIDYDFYNPATDSAIFKNYDVDTLENKVLNKKIWQDELGLPVDGRTPMIAVVSRLVSHKGIDLLTKVLEDVLQKDVQFVVVGTGDSRYVDYFKYLENKYPTKVRALVDKYSNESARRAYAASDIFLMPSKIEPCGISQMIASRYGSVPIVREVGGLKDTIKDFGCVEGGNGYTFANYNPNDLLSQINRAINDYNDENGWKNKMRIVMTTDFSWDKSAKKYLDLYKSLIN